VRCKHYCAPVIEVADRAEVEAIVARIPLRDETGLLFRGQSRLFTLPRAEAVRKLLFASSCNQEPSLTTSASRRPGYDYDQLHFLLRHFIETKLLAAGDPVALDAWQAGLASPVCEIDHALMALAQHYGLPSHGLDITTSLDVALWFATNLLAFTPSAASYAAMGPGDWPVEPDDRPVLFVHQAVTHSIRPSLHDCHELDAFGYGALRPERQSARFFLGGHSEHRNRLAETLVCVLRLAPGAYVADATFERLFPSPAEDPGYALMLEFADVAGFGDDLSVLRFHP
jgi:hypothetical protein